MTCFEARKEFVAFWRRTLAPAKREAFNAHLHECAQCANAFRVFALSAPVLHSQSEPEGNSYVANLSIIPSRAPRANTGTYAEPRPWAAASAAIVMVAAAVLAVYVVSVPPYQTLANSLIDDSSAAGIVSSVSGSALFGQDVPAADFNSNPASEGLLGQDSPTDDIAIPGVTGLNRFAITNNLAG